MKYGMLDHLRESLCESFSGRHGYGSKLLWDSLIKLKGNWFLIY